jgi:hypothetical protein
MILYETPVLELRNHIFSHRIYLGYVVFMVPSVKGNHADLKMIRL